jgi:hypothetical protein
VPTAPSECRRRYLGPDNLSGFSNHIYDQFPSGGESHQRRGPLDQRGNIRQDKRADFPREGLWDDGRIRRHEFNFIDSCACLSGFGPDHEVTCTIANSAAVSGLEVEILLRAAIAPNHISLYEIDCITSISGISLVRWDMTTANPNSFTVLRNFQVGEVPLADGDQVYGSIVGTLITVKYKRAGGAFSTLFTYNTAADSVKYSSGNPGISFWNETGSAANQSKFAWSNFTANTL